PAQVSRPFHSVRPAPRGERRSRSTKHTARPGRTTWRRGAAAGRAGSRRTRAGGPPVAEGGQSAGGRAGSQPAGGRAGTRRPGGESGTGGGGGQGDVHVVGGAVAHDGEGRPVAGAVLAHVAGERRGLVHGAVVDGDDDVPGPQPGVGGR